jgi:cell filamentation protein
MQGATIDPATGARTVAPLKAVHRRIFRDVQEWAGVSDGERFQERPSLRIGCFPRSTAAVYSDRSSGSQLAAEKHLVGFDAENFAGRTAYFIGELNAAGPFDEGNGRTRCEFIRELGLKAGHFID